jgi:ribosomal protein S12 methylthiotransferase
VSRVAIVTLGCPKNAVDSEALGGLLAAGGHEVTEAVDESEVVVLNTCGFIDPARRETVEEVLALADLKQEGDLRGLVLTGCLVARSGSDLAESLPEVDALVDFAAYPRISEIVHNVSAGQRTQSVHGDPGPRFDPAWWDAALAASPRLRFGRSPWAYLKIAEGCDRGCTFCAIPLMRGKLRSRSAATIEAEARRLVELGVTELSLVSQDSVMWGRDIGEDRLADLIRRLEGIDGLRRVRLMYLHPQGVTDELVDVLLASPVVVDYFDLSLQHVSPAVLRGMGRWGGSGRFMRIIERIRAADPLAGIRSTFILGFPGESDRDAAEVEAFVEEAELDWVGVFGYSRESGTRSYRMTGQIDEPTIRERVERVAAVADEAMARRAAELVGRELEVLVERLDIDTGAWIGRSQREAPEIDGEIRLPSGGGLGVGDYVSAWVTASSGADLDALPLSAHVAGTGH